MRGQAEQAKDECEQATGAAMQCNPAGSQKCTSVTQIADHEINECLIPLFPALDPSASAMQLLPKAVGICSNPFSAS